MKIHGTAKGGAISKKDFGVAFGGAAGNGTTYSTDFSTHGAWSDNQDNVFIDTENEMLEFDLTDSNTDQFMNYDLGSSVSDTKWLLRYEMTFTTLAVNTADDTNILQIGFYSTDSPSGYKPSGDTLRYGVEAGYGTNRANKLSSINGTTETITDQNNDPFSLSASTGTTYYMEIVRISADLLQMSVYENSDYSSEQVGSTMSRATSSAVQGTSELTVNLFSGTVGGAGMVGYIQNLKFWDGVTTPP